MNIMPVKLMNPKEPQTDRNMHLFFTYIPWYSFSTFKAIFSGSEKVEHILKVSSKNIRGPSARYNP